MTTLGQQHQGFILRIDPDWRFADLECVHSDDSSVMFVAAALPGALKEAGIIYGIDPEAARDAFEKLPQMEPGTKTRIAVATEAVQGVNGSIEYLVNVSGRAQYQAAEDDDAAVDYKKATMIGSVQPGQQLAVAHPPVPGKMGVTIQGKTIPSRNGKPVILRCGANVDLDESTGTYVALEQGRPVLEGSVLSVLPVYEVSGDIDYSTGHVTFGGSVLVHGNVQDGFNITARDVEVNGVVGASEIRAKGNVTINGGVNGKNKAFIEAGGVVCAKYVNQARVESVGDVKIRRELINSTVWTRGRVTAGTLMGGEVLALKGVELAVFGSDMGVLTRVEPGIDYEHRKLEQKQEKFNMILDQLLGPVEMYLGDRGKFKALPPEKKAEIAAVYEQFKRVKKAHNILTEQIMAMGAAESSDPIKEVVVRKMMYQDCFVRTSLCQRSFDKEHIGPLVLVEDMERGSIRLAPYSERTNYDMEVV